MNILGANMVIDGGYRVTVWQMTSWTFRDTTITLASRDLTNIYLGTIIVKVRSGNLGKTRCTGCP